MMTFHIITISVLAIQGGDSDEFFPPGILLLGSSPKCAACNVFLFLLLVGFAKK